MVASFSVSSRCACSETSLMSQLGFSISRAGLASTTTVMPASLPVCWACQRNSVGQANVGRANDLVASDTRTQPRRQAMPTHPSLNPQVIGQAESALGAILDPLLARTGTTFNQWLVLTVSAASGATIDRDQLL